LEKKECCPSSYKNRLNDAKTCIKKEKGEILIRRSIYRFSLQTPFSFEGLFLTGLLLMKGSIHYYGQKEVNTWLRKSIFKQV
jgi:hypothetical protein